jgi:inositol transport system substrate-binding protein
MHRIVPKRVVGLTMAAAMMVGTAGTGAVAQDDLTIGVTFPIFDQFLQTVETGMQERADEIGGITLNFVSAEEDTVTQQGQVETFITQEVDAIVVIPVDTDAAGPMTDAAAAAEIPLVYVNRRPSDLPTDGSVPYVGSDSLFAGTAEMEMLAELANYEGNVVIIQGDPANEAAILRTQGCMDVIDANEGLNLLFEPQAGFWFREQGLDIMENWIQTGEQIDIVCANNDEMALGAIEALKGNDMLDDVLVGGVDATAVALESMAAGELDVTVFQNAAAQGGGGVDAAVALINGETIEGMVDGVVDVPYEPVGPDDVEKYQEIVGG